MRLASAPRQVRSRWPVYEEDELAAVADVLRSGRVNALHHGERCRAFEQAFAAWCDMPAALSVANGTVALELALRALGVGSGDEVVVTSRSFIASASCVVACGATPVFADVDPESQNLTARSIAAVLTARTRAIIPVHLGGWPCAMDEVMALADGHGLLVIEDCAQAHGASHGGRPVGSFGHAAVFSFCTDKIISAGGEGGMILFREGRDREQAWSLSNHGKDPAAHGAPPGPRFRWMHGQFGGNCRLTELQAAIGLQQLAKLPRRLELRRSNAALLLSALAPAATLRLVRPPAECGHAYYAFYAFVRPERLASGWSRDRIVETAIGRGIPCRSGICPEIYLEEAFRREGIGPRARLPVARMLGETSLSLPVDQTLTAEEMLWIGAGLRAVADEAGRMAA